MFVTAPEVPAAPPAPAVAEPRPPGSRGVAWGVSALAVSGTALTLNALRVGLHDRHCIVSEPDGPAWDDDTYETGYDFPSFLEIISTCPDSARGMQALSPIAFSLNMTGAVLGIVARGAFKTPSRGPARHWTPMASLRILAVRPVQRRIRASPSAPSSTPVPTQRS